MLLLSSATVSHGYSPLLDVPSSILSRYRCVTTVAVIHTPEFQIHTRRLQLWGCFPVLILIGTRLVINGVLSGFLFVLFEDL